MGTARFSIRADSAKSLFASPPEIGEFVRQSLNQAKRRCEVVAVHGARYVVEYEMPSGVVFLRQGAAGKTERPVAIKALPKWAVDQVSENTSYFLGPKGNQLYTEDRADEEYRRRLQATWIDTPLAEDHQPDPYLKVFGEWMQALAAEGSHPCDNGHDFKLADAKTHYWCKRCFDCISVQSVLDDMTLGLPLDAEDEKAANEAESRYQEAFRLHAEEARLCGAGALVARLNEYIRRHHSACVIEKLEEADLATTRARVNAFEGEILFRLECHE